VVVYSASQKNSFSEDRLVRNGPASRETPGITFAGPASPRLQFGHVVHGVQPPLLSSSYRGGEVRKRSKALCFDLGGFRWLSRRSNWLSPIDTPERKWPGGEAAVKNAVQAMAPMSKRKQRQIENVADLLKYMVDHDGLTDEQYALRPSFKGARSLNGETRPSL
jgi:hypothetical protein